jgi:hypothetical protein
MAPKRTSKQQQQLNVDQFKLLKKPMDHLGMPDFQPDCPSARALCNLQFPQVSDEAGRGTSMLAPCTSRPCETLSPSTLHPCLSNMALRSRRLPAASRSFVGLRSSSPAQIPPVCCSRRRNVDTVLDELKRWEDKDLQEYSQYIAEGGLLNEFKMMWELRESFPLHFTCLQVDGMPPVTRGQR